MSKRCRCHELQYGEVTWDESRCPACPVCAAEKELELQRKALICITKKVEEIHSRAMTSTRLEEENGKAPTTDAGQKKVEMKLVFIPRIG